MNKNCLSRPEARRLEDLVLEHEKEITSGKWTKVTFADLAGRRMGRPVSAGNVQGASKAVGVSFPRATSGSAIGSLRELKAAVQWLAKELAQLKGELGQVVSPTLRELANGAADKDNN